MGGRNEQRSGDGNGKCKARIVKVWHAKKSEWVWKAESERESGWR